MAEEQEAFGAFPGREDEHPAVVGVACAAADLEFPGLVLGGGDRGNLGKYALFGCARHGEADQAFPAAFRLPCAGKEEGNAVLLDVDNGVMGGLCLRQIGIIYGRGYPELGACGHPQALEGGLPAAPLNGDISCKEDG